MMNPDSISSIRLQIERELAELQASLRPNGSIVEELQGVDRENRVIPVLLATHNGNDTRQRIEDRQAALERMARGTYGICVDCGQEINPERLKIRPEASRCVPCQSLVMKTRG